MSDRFLPAIRYGPGGRKVPAGDPFTELRAACRELDRELRLCELERAVRTFASGVRVVLEDRPQVNG